MNAPETRIITTPRAIGPVYAFVAAVPTFVAFTPILWWETALSSSSTLALIAKLLIAVGVLSFGVRLSRHYVTQAFVITDKDEIMRHATIWFTILSLFGMELIIDIPYSLGAITLIIAFQVLTYLYPLEPDVEKETQQHNLQEE